VDKELLDKIAKQGKGRFYYAEDPVSVPQIFAKETIEAGKEALQKQPFVPRLYLPAPVVSGLDWESCPPLGGYVKTRLKVNSEQNLVTERLDPLLAWCRTGLGICTAFTSNARPDWADPWLTDWPEGYSRFWAQVARHTMRKTNARGIEMQVERRGRTARVTVEAVDALGRFLNDAGLELTVHQLQAGRHAPLPLRQTAPGRYNVSFDASLPGDYILHLVQKDGHPEPIQQTRVLSVGYPDELRCRPADEALLEALARATGGIYRPAPEQVLAPGADAVPRRVALWEYLVMAAALLWVVDVALRRLDLTAWFRTSLAKE
jgi:hypothetical protein